MLNSWIKVINGITSGLNGLTGLLGKVGIEIPKIGQIAEVTFGRIGQATDKAAGSAADFRKIEEEQKGAIKATGDAAGETATEIGGLDKATSKAADSAKKAATAVKELRDGLGQSFSDAVKRAGDILQKAKDDFTEYAKSVSGAISGAFSFGEAFKSSADANKELTEALAAQEKAELAVIDARKGEDPEKIKQANIDLKNAIDDVVKAQTQPLTFFDSLEAQATKARDFGVLVNRLIAGGLSQEALQQVLDAGIDAGSGIATELLSSADGILRANTLAADVAAVGTQVGLNAAGNFKQAGVTAGQALVDGINQSIAGYKISLKSKKLSAKQLKKLQKDFNLQVEFTLGAGGEVPALANGAIVNRPQMSLIGEAGAEAVIPLTRPARALALMEQSGLASLARQSSATVSIQNATFVEPIDAQLLAAKVMAAEKARSFA